MPKVYPNAAAAAGAASSSPSDEIEISNGKIKISGGGGGDDDPVVLTVWKKSLLLNCEGFTVFDPRGNLVFRVDNYMAATKGHIFLMDASGATLLTIRRKRLSLGDTWVIFDGESETAENPMFTVRKNVSLLNINKRCLLADVSSSCSQKKKKKKKKKVYQIEGSYSRRCCTIYDDNRHRLAEIRQKEASVKGVAFGKDVFRLEMHPGFHAPLAMAMVILLDQMYSH